ncbi:hypothetical protein, partial [Nocardioides sp. Root79]|uniref:hypothetical protein n=1 Tax=Nocardioides sp. Root79 TaxID=1736600 RepID=UPI00138EFDAE
MRTQLLGLTTAALAVGTLSLGLSSPAQAGGGIDGGNISTSGDVPNSVDVAAYGDGDALAAWARPVPGGTKVYAAIATNGVWGAPKAVTAAAVTSAHDVQAVADDAGDLAVVWNQTTGGEHKVRGSRYLANGTWDGSTLLSPSTDITTVSDIDAEMDGAGRVHVAYKAIHAATPRVRTAFWRKGAAPVLGEFPNWTRNPSIAVNSAGQVLMSYSDTNDVLVTRRTATVGWLGPKVVAWPDTVAWESKAVVADDGKGAVIIGGWDGANYRAVVARVGATGTLGAPKLVSGAGVEASHRDLAMSPNGTLQATWSSFEGAPNGNVIRVATAKPGADFAGAGLAETGMDSVQDNVGLISDRGLQVITHKDDNLLTLRHRSNPILVFGSYDAGPTNGAFAADMDRNGDVVAVGVVENGFSSFVRASWYDMSGPVSKVTAPGAQVVARQLDVKWSAVDALMGTKSTDVIVRSALWNSTTFNTPAVVGDDLAASPLHLSVGTGRTYCFEVQSVDKANTLGLRSPLRCTTIPLDDKALAGKGWTRQTHAGQFNNTWTTTTKKNRVLTRTGIKAKRLALVVQRVPNGGTVRVTWNGTTIKNLSLKG